MFFDIILIWNYFFAFMVILNRNSLYSIISLICLITGSVIILFFLNIEFLSFIILLIYIGAVSVLFLFIIMMFNLNKEEIQKNILFILSTKYLIYIVILFKISFFIIYFNKKLSLLLNTFSYEFINYNEDLNIFYNLLFKIDNDIIIFVTIFSQKYFFFILIGIVLLFSMIGSISLCVRKA